LYYWLIPNRIKLISILAASFMFGALVSKVQRVSRIWVVDKLSLTGISVAYILCCGSPTVCVGDGWVVVWLCASYYGSKFQWWYKYASWSLFFICVCRYMRGLCSTIIYYVIVLSTLDPLLTIHNETKELYKWTSKSKKTAVTLLLSMIWIWDVKKERGFFPMESLISPMKEKNYGQFLLLESIWNRPITAFVVL
jgi:hypothetical protein